MQKKWQADIDHLQKFHIWKYIITKISQKKYHKTVTISRNFTELYWIELIEKKLLVILDPLESSMSKAQELHIFHLEQKKQKNSRNDSDLPIISMTTAT